MSSRQLLYGLIYVGYLQHRENLLETVFIIPCFEVIHLLNGACEQFGIAALKGMLIIAQCARHRVVAFETSVDNALRREERRHLLEIAHSQIVVKCDFSGIVVFQAGNDAQQGGLAGAVFGYQAHFVTFVYAKSHVAKQHSVAVGFC